MKKLQVYIAAGSAHYGLVAYYARHLEASGLVEFTFRWWETASEWTGRDRLLEVAEQASRADACLEGVAMAQLVWCMRDPESEGSRIELGAAMERRRILRAPYIVLTGPGVGSSMCRSPGSSIFHGLVDYRSTVHCLGLENVLRVARERAKEVA